MDTQVAIIEDTVAYLLGIINDMDRNKAVMISTYPNWDNVDTAEFKTRTIARLNLAIAKLGAL
jgi:hypothetical protein